MPDTSIDERYLASLDMDAEIKKHKGSWKNRLAFSWGNAPEDADNWTLIPIQSRDAALLEKCNAQVVRNEFKPYLGEDCYEIRCSSTLFGWIDEIAVKVIDAAGNPTEAFRKALELSGRLEADHILDETLYCKMQTDESIANIEKACTGLVVDNPPPDTYEIIYLRFCNDPKISETEDGIMHPDEDDVKPILKEMALLDPEMDDD
jgi:cation diffusion facilitator CzcD-associated flavoprotein CzcO